MIPVYSVEQVRAAESRAFSQLPEGELMARAVRGLFRVCREVLTDRRGGLYGARVVILAGAGNNGADALWTGVRLVGRGVQVTAISATDKVEPVSSNALRAVGGRLIGPEISEAEFEALTSQADIVLDGLLGIGASGALRDPAATWSQALLHTPAEIISVDLPSGVDPDSGVIADPEAAIRADQTVCLGTVKAGLLLGDGPDFAGEITLVDIGLLDYFDETAKSAPLLEVVDLDDASDLMAAPQRFDNKYTRGVVGVVSGSEKYPGAAVLSTGGALQGGAGMVRYAGGAPGDVVAKWPEVVVESSVDHDSKTNAWVVGSGGGVDSLAAERLNLVLDASVPVVLDADGLTLVSESDDLRRKLTVRHSKGLPTVLTPHDGEFARLGYQTTDVDGQARVATLTQAANDLGAVILLKGATTLVATPDGHVFANDEASPVLATAGSGDVLAGLLGSMLAHHAARLAQGSRQTTDLEAGRVAVSAALIHGLAGIEAASLLGSVVATDILNELPAVLLELELSNVEDDEGYDESEEVPR
ncbi:MAG: NAD(P)H-hydrate dehydratase [Candidatus Nanopelagicales bacterium]